MKSGKFLFIAIIFLVSLLCISAVSAADEAVSDVIADTNDVTVLEESIDDVDLGDSESNELGEIDENNVLTHNEDDEEPISSTPMGTWESLNFDVNGNNNNEVYLISDYEYGEIDDISGDFKHGIVINRSVTIYGNGHTIDARNQARIFHILKDNVVTFKNINFVNASAPGDHAFGGAIWAENYATVEAINCTFTNNNASYAGGAINNGNAINCTFTGNSASQGGAIYIGTATNCTFTGNNVENFGGACYETIVKNSNFTGNSASNGGAIVFGSATDCIFNYNNARYDGGAIYETDAVNCTFTGNFATSGGAMYYNTATDCTFTGNSASGYGGAMYHSAATDCTFTQNTAGNNGGAIYNGDATDCTFSKNNASNGGAISEGNAINCNFTENYADDEGGAIYNGDATDCTFSKNNASGGGAISVGNAINCNFIRNHAEAGGAIYDSNASNCNFTENTAGFIGGAIYSSYYGQATASNCNFIKNSAYMGGAIGGGGQFTATNCNFKQNTAYEGGAIYADDEFNVMNCSFTDNTAETEGDDVYGNLTTDENSKILHNTVITASAVTATYNVNKYLTITLKDANGKPLSNVTVTVTLGTAKKYTTDKYGQIKINVAKLVPKAYTAKISFAGNAYYTGVTKNVKVTVKKATPKLTAKKKTFKVKVKTKKYTVTLKNNKGKVLKKVKLTLKVGKKTYKATTNSKGKATFKITKLTKKGKYTATIKFAGSKIYNKLTKKVKITVKK